jgi:hypothetical protein
VTDKAHGDVDRVVAALGGATFPYHTFGRFRLRRRWVKATPPGPGEPAPEPMQVLATLSAVAPVVVPPPDNILVPPVWREAISWPDPEPRDEQERLHSEAADEIAPKLPAPVAKPIPPEMPLSSPGPAAEAEPEPPFVLQPAQVFEPEPPLPPALPVLAVVEPQIEPPPEPVASGPDATAPAAPEPVAAVVEAEPPVRPRLLLSMASLPGLWDDRSQPAPPEVPPVVEAPVAAERQSKTNIFQLAWANAAAAEAAETAEPVGPALAAQQSPAAAPEAGLFRRI